MLKNGTVLKDRYEIIKVIGQGGMSTVYQAKDLKNNNHLLAIKDVDRAGFRDNQQMEQKLAVSEGRILEQLSNPHLPKIYEIIENQDNFLLVMDYIEGVSLDKVISYAGPQPVERVLNWGIQICEVLHYLHSQPTPIIYRDMKPGNVILRPDGYLTLIDFGTARTMKLNVQMREDTICIGTAGFAAPEQYGGYGQSTERTDIFCLGATLYNLVTGHSPSENPVGIHPLDFWNPALANSPLQVIISKATRNDPNERYQTVMEMYDDLRRASTGEFPMPGKSIFSGALRKSGWQRQENQTNGMISSSLSGLLAWGKNNHNDMEPSGNEMESNREKTDSAPERGFQKIVPEIAKIPNAEYNLKLQQETEYAKRQDLWRLIVLIAVALAFIFVLFSVISVMLKQNTLAVIFLSLAFAGIALGVLGVIVLKR